MLPRYRPLRIPPGWIPGIFCIATAIFPAVAGGSMRLCAQRLAAAPQAEESPVAAMALAWEDLFKLGLAGPKGAQFRNWALQNVQAEPAGAAADWLGPPETLLSSELSVAFEQLRFFRTQIRDGSSESAVFDADLGQAIVSALRSELAADEVAEDAIQTRASRAVRLAEDSSVSLGSFSSSMTDMVELSDRRLVLLGFSLDSRMLSFLDRSSGAPVVTPITAGSFLRTPGGSTMGFLEALPSGGFVASDVNARIAFFSVEGHMTESYDSADATTTTRSRPLVLADGTVVFVKSNGLVYFFDEKGRIQGSAIRLPHPPSLMKAVVLRDGTFGVVLENRFVIYDSSGRLLAQCDAGERIAAPPAELVDGRLAIVSETRLGFFDRKGRLDLSVPLQASSQTMPLALPDGGVVLVAQNRLFLFDAKGSVRNGDGFASREHWYLGPLLKVDLPSGEWGIIALTNIGIVGVDSEGVGILAEQLASKPAGAQMVNLTALSDGTIVVADSQAKVTMLRLQPLRNGRGSK